MAMRKYELPPEVHPDQVLPRDRPERCSKCKYSAFTGPKYVSFGNEHHHWVSKLQWDGLEWTCKNCGHTTLTACKDSKLWKQIEEGK
jgi:predicted nucleic-acid-binding Zn-ribbon protein